jgi:hypothetical protein
MVAAPPQTLTELLAELSRRGIQIVPRGERLRYRPRSALTPDLLKRLKTHKGELLTILRPFETPGEPDLAPAADRPERARSREEHSTDPPAPCLTCGGLLSWWNPLGDRRCMACDPPTKAIRLLERSEQIRRRHRIPSPTGAAEMLAELKRTSST